MSQLELLARVRRRGLGELECSRVSDAKTSMGCFSSIVRVPNTSRRGPRSSPSLPQSETSGVRTSGQEDVREVASCSWRYSNFSFHFTSAALGFAETRSEISLAALELRQCLEPLRIDGLRKLHHAYLESFPRDRRVISVDRTGRRGTFRLRSQRQNDLSPTLPAVSRRTARAMTLPAILFTPALVSHGQVSRRDPNTEPALGGRHCLLVIVEATSVWTASA